MSAETQKDILVIDNNLPYRIFLQRHLEELQYRFSGIPGAEINTLPPTYRPDLVLIDSTPPHNDGLGTLQQLRGRFPQLPAVMMARSGRIEWAADTTQKDATFWLKPKLSRNQETIKQALDKLGQTINDRLHPLSPSKEILKYQQEFVDHFPRYEAVGQSQYILELYAKSARVAKLPDHKFLTGERGSGKGQLAYALHKMSGRKGEFVHFNCALPEQFVLVALRGTERGGYTGAVRQLRGIFERANGGTLFLDQLDAATQELQELLLTVLDDLTIERVGSDEEKPITLNVNIISAINKDSLYLIEHGLLIEDLYDRLNQIHFHLEPLDNHREDIPLITAYLLYRRQPKLSLTNAGLTLLKRGRWMGNIRQLDGVLIDSAAETVGEVISERTIEKIMDYRGIAKAA